jgi:hypothetical protein
MEYNLQVNIISCVNEFGKEPFPTKSVLTIFYYKVGALIMLPLCEHHADNCTE